MLGVHLRDKLHNVHGRLFQARMWRRFVLDWDGKPGGCGYSREWMEKVFKRSREYCIRAARVNLYLARRLNRAEADSGPVI